MKGRSVFAGVFALLACGLVHSHATGTNYLFVTADSSDSIEVRWDIGIGDLHWALSLDANRDGRITWGEIELARGDIVGLALRELSLNRGGTLCAVDFNDLRLTEHAGQPFASLTARGSCREGGPLEVSSTLFVTEDTSQRTLLEAVTQSDQFVAVLSPSAPTWQEPARSSWWATLLVFIGEGAWHVWIGYDHVAFLLLLILPSVLRSTPAGWQAERSRWRIGRDVVAIVTAFTVAHSVTLALAATGTVSLPSRPVEAAIAASVVAAGLLNLAPRAAYLRLPLAFGFGLVHGFGFAGVLGDLRSGGAGLVPMLAGFNLGVELGQLVIVAVTLPLIASLRKRDVYARRIMPAASIAIGAAGAVWLAARVA